MAFLPRSLFGRMVVILIAGLLVAQLLSTALLMRDRSEVAYRASGLQLAQNIARVVHMLDSVSVAERHRLLSTLNVPPMQISLLAQPLEFDQQTTGPREELLGRLLQHHLGVQQPLRVHLLEGPQERSPSAAPLSPIGAPMRPLHAIAFNVQVQLGDGSWALFEHRIDSTLFDWPRRILLTLGLLIGSVVLLSLFAVRWLTRPLALLANAAEQLGKDLRTPPLAETGPQEVRRAAHAFNRMQGRLLRFIEDRSRILAAVSHDLKTPITRLRLRSELLEDEPLRRKFLKDLDEMETMVRGTLDFMRSVDNDEPLQPLDVNALVESLQQDTAEAGGEIAIAGAAKAPYLARPLALKRCLTNLIDNAVHYGRRATVIIEDSRERLRIVVADEGPGLPEELLEKAFEPFFRAEASRSRDTGGTGLGLGIARNIARAHGGDLVLGRRSEGTGLHAVLTLPR